MTEGHARAGEPDVPDRVRRFVYGFLAVLLVCALVGIEAWPFSAFKLFSARRDDERVSWRIVTVDPGGHEELVDLAALPIGYRNTTTVLREFEGMSPEGRDEVCRAWARPHVEGGVPVDHVRVYRRTTRLGEDPPEPTTELVWTCGR